MTIASSQESTSCITHLVETLKVNLQGVYRYPVPKLFHHIPQDTCIHHQRSTANLGPRGFDLRGSSCINSLEVNIWKTSSIRCITKKSLHLISIPRDQRCALCGASWAHFPIFWPNLLPYLYMDTRYY